MAVVSFGVNVQIKNADSFAARSGRYKDLTPLWDNIIDEWMIHNVDKFNLSRDSEETGVEYGDNYWEPLTPRYKAEKEAQGYENWLMVREGDLKEDLTTGRFQWNWFEKLDPDHCSFGSLNPIVGYQADKRLVQFFDSHDRNMISSEAFQYLTGGAKYGGNRFISPVMQMKEEAKEYDAMFEMAVNTEG